MEVICGIFLIVTGIIMITKPKTIWRIAEAWKVKADTEPTDIYTVLIRIVGCILVIGGIFAILGM